MDAYRVIITPRAGSDLERIYDYIAKDSPGRAAQLITRILDSIEPLKQFPHRAVRDGHAAKLRYPVRSLPVRPYIIYFRVLDDEKIVRVLHVRHGSRRRPGRLE